MYKISIIVPVFNVEDSLDMAFMSIKNQTFGFENIEVILIDDASTDSSSKRIDEYSDSYENVKAIHLDENSGYAGKPRNVGIENATSPYLIFLDSDDELLPEACSILYGLISEGDADVVNGNYIVTDMKGRREYDFKGLFDLNDGILRVDNVSSQPNLFEVPPSLWSRIFKRQFIIDNGIMFREDIPAQDLVFVDKCLFNADGIIVVDRPVISYAPRLKGIKTSVTADKSKKNMLGYLKAYYDVYDTLKDHEEYYRYLFKHLNFWSRQFITSSLDFSDKLDLLTYAYPLFELFKDNEDLKPNHSLKEFFFCVYRKDFIEAIRFCELWALKVKPYVMDKVKSKDIFVLVSGEESERDLSVIELLKTNHYKIKLIDANVDEDILDDFKRTDKSKISLFNSNLDYQLSFDNSNDYCEYVISKLSLKSDEKPFLICFAPSENANIKGFDAALAYKISKSDSEWSCDRTYDVKPLVDSKTLSIDDVAKFLSDIYIKETKKEYNVEKDISKLKRKNEKLKSENESLISSTSWKITEPLRKIKNIKK